MASRATRRNARSAISIVRCKRLARVALAPPAPPGGRGPTPRPRTWTKEGRGVGKDCIGMVDGVPAGLLILIYVFTNLF
jgi:hypothetical protein